MANYPSMRVVKLAINSLFYVINLSAYLVLIKYIENRYSYSNFWFNNLLSIVLAPLYFFWLVSRETRKRLHLYGRAILFPILAGVCYTVESILLYYSVNNLNLSYYTILRSSFIIWNVPFFVFFLKKRVSYIYWTSCVLLLVSYTFSIYFYISNFGNSWKPTLAIGISCIINSAYNNVIEHSIKQYRIQNIDYQLVFQNTYFILAIGPSVYYTAIEPPPVNGYLVASFILIALMLQLFIYNKISILRDSSSKIPSNVLMAGLDLLRRFILLLFSFLMFNEPLNNYIIVSLVLFVASSGCMFIDYLVPKNAETDAQPPDTGDEIELLP